MKTEYSKNLLQALAGICFVLAMFVSTDARADFLIDVENAVDATGELPFKFSEWRPIIAACENDSDIVDCADAYANSPMGQADLNGAGVDNGTVNQIFTVYTDLKNKDYWQLLADAGQTVACAAAKILTGIDVCDILGSLYDGAKAIVDWFGGLFGGNSYTPTLGETSAYPCLGGQRVLPNGQCSYCPLGQALIGPHDLTKYDPKDGTKLDSNYNTCGFCPQPTQSVTQTSDRCWTTSGSTQGAPMPDGSSCSGGGYTNAPVCCPAGAVSPSSGVCAPACGQGQIWDKASNSCTSCGSGATAQYDKPGHGSAGKCMCDPFGATVMDQNGNCVNNCGPGSVRDANGNCTPMCGAGQVFDKDSNSCHGCGGGTVPNYYNVPSKSSYGTCTVCYNGGVAENGQCVCPAGQMGVPPRNVCQKCPANFFNLHSGSTSCTECPDNQFSVPGSPGCHMVTCGALMHPSHHKCVPNFVSPTQQQQQRQ